ncbi:MAG: hypothetical protein ACJAV6_000655 [Candidatus Paceibacteria bacterium]|jgi:hypothetical protein
MKFSRKRNTLMSQLRYIVSFAIIFVVSTNFSLQVHAAEMKELLNHDVDPSESQEEICRNVKTDKVIVVTAAFFAAISANAKLVTDEEHRSFCYISGHVSQICLSHSELARSHL